jgi:Sec-independent protein translocase protein TatA
MPLEPELLDYQNTQVLIIGEGMGELRRAVEEQKEDAKDDEKEKPEEEMEKLEEEVSSSFPSQTFN